MATVPALRLGELIATFALVFAGFGAITSAENRGKQSGNENAETGREDGVEADLKPASMSGNHRSTEAG